MLDVFRVKLISNFKVKQVGKRWQVYGRVYNERLRQSLGLKGVQVMRRFADRVEAEEWVAKAQRLAQSMSAQRLNAVNTWLTAEQVREAEAAALVLGSDGSLLKAAKQFQAVAQVRAPSGKLLRELLILHLGAMEVAERSARTVEDVRLKLLRVFKLGGMERAEDVTLERARVALAQCGAGITRVSYQLKLEAFARWLWRNGWLTCYPLDGLERIIVSQGLPFIHTAAEVAMALERVRERWPHMLSWFAIGYFCGLRPEAELHHITREQIFLDGEHPEILVKRQKVRALRPRMAPISPNLRDILQGCEARGWPLCGQGYPVAKEVIRALRTGKKQGTLGRQKQGSVPKVVTVPWKADVMRHTFATYWLAVNGNIHLLASIMGNSPKMIQQSYLNLAERRREEAEKFWRIVV